MKITLLFLFMLNGFALKAQEDENAVLDTITDTLKKTKTDQEELIGCRFEHPPSFVGDMPALNKFLKDNLHYPDSCSHQGTVWVNFLIEKDGRVTHVRVLKGVCKEIDAEAIRVVCKMPNWTQSKQDGKPIAVQYNLPIKFKRK